MLGTILSQISRYKFHRQLSALKKQGLRVGENTFINIGASLDPSHCFLISIGNNCTLAPNVKLIAHDASMKRLLDFTRIGKIRIHDRCFIGESSIILPGVSIGPDAVIGAGSVVTRDVPPNSVAAGNPARVLCSVDAFIKKHREKMTGSKCFMYSRYEISVISKKDMEEMTAYLDKHIAYIE